MTSKEIECAHERLCALLDHYRIRATFAFVAAFTMSEGEARDKIQLFEDVGSGARRWLAPFMEGLTARRTDGWLVPGALATVRRAGGHEIGSHGFSHLPLIEGEISREECRRELEGIFKTDAFAGSKELTFIYPRNQIGFKAELGRLEFVGYRESDVSPAGERGSRWRHLFDELNLFSRAQPHAAADGHLMPVPAAQFLNWRSGMRARIPIPWTVAMWKNIILDAVRNRRVAHLYSHPHNFITGSGMFELFEEVLKFSAPFVRTGEIWNPTMREYALSARR